MYIICQKGVRHISDFCVFPVLPPGERGIFVSAESERPGKHPHRTLFGRRRIALQGSVRTNPTDDREAAHRQSLVQGKLVRITRKAQNPRQVLLHGDRTYKPTPRRATPAYSVPLRFHSQTVQIAHRCHAHYPPAGVQRYRPSRGALGRDISMEAGGKGSFQAVTAKVRSDYRVRSLCGNA